MTLVMTETMLNNCRVVLLCENNGRAFCDILKRPTSSATSIRLNICDVLGCHRDDLMETLRGINFSDVRIITSEQARMKTRVARKARGEPSRYRKSIEKSEEQVVADHASVWPEPGGWPDYSRHNITFR